MKQKFNILIAEKNPHVRELLKREMIADGYRVRLAENARQLFNWIRHNEHIDLLVVDPDLPDTDVSSFITELHDRFPLLTVVIHTFTSNYQDNLETLRVFPFVEKGGSSIECLKKVVFDILHRFDQKHN